MRHVYFNLPEKISLLLLGPFELHRVGFDLSEKISFVPLRTSELQGLDIELRFYLGAYVLVWLANLVVGVLASERLEGEIGKHTAGKIVWKASGAGNGLVDSRTR